jgi:RNA 2',3'-cyclic 3'-phosphodiesterase
LRVFIALDIPADVRAAIGALIRRLQPSCRAARWVRVEGMHVTLKFIGEAPEERVARVKAALAAVRSAAPVEMRFAGTGFFPNERRPRVFWTGIHATPNLAELATEMEQRLELLGIPREQRAFHPHLTLARFDSPTGLARLLDELRAAGAPELGAARTSEFHLYQSVLKRGGAEYTKLATFAFAEEPGPS